MALPLCDSIEAVERAAATIARTRSSGNDAVVAGSLVRAWSRIGRYESVVLTTLKALETGGWDHQAASKALTSALKHVLGLGKGDSVIQGEASRRRSSGGRGKGSQWSQQKTAKTKTRKTNAEKQADEHRWGEAKSFFSVLQRSGLADGYQ